MLIAGAPSDLLKRQGRRPLVHVVRAYSECFSNQYDGMWPDSRTASYHSKRFFSQTFALSYSAALSPADADTSAVVGLNHRLVFLDWPFLNGSIRYLCGEQRSLSRHVFTLLGSRGTRSISSSPMCKVKHSRKLISNTCFGNCKCEALTDPVNKLT